MDEDSEQAADEMEEEVRATSDEQVEGLRAGSRNGDEAIEAEENDEGDDDYLRFVAPDIEPNLDA